jgi:hypothetical protein
MAKTWKYSVHPGVEMTQGIITKLKEKTGKTFDEWVALAKKSGPKDEKERADWLKSKHGLGTNYAGWISERSFGRGLESSDPEAYLKAADVYVEDMFAGPKAALRPIYDRLLDLAFSLGKDIRVSPGKTIVPIYRNHVIAQVKPSTRTRIDFGLALGDLKATGKLKSTGGFEKKDRITHAIPISSAAEVDAEVQRWLRKAYELDGSSD